MLEKEKLKAAVPKLTGKKKRKFFFAITPDGAQTCYSGITLVNELMWC